MDAIRVSKKALNKQNISRIYGFSVLMGLLLLPVWVVFKLLGFAFLNSDVQDALFISLIAFFLIAALFSNIIVKNRMSSKYRIFISSFWSLFCIFGVASTYLAADSGKAILCYLFTLVSLGFVPIIKLKRFLLYWASQLVMVSGVFFVQTFSSEGVISMVAVNIMCILLNSSTYNSNMKNLAFKASLTDAITQAETDPMTRLLNRRGLERRVSNIWPHCIRQKTDVAVIMMDIDFFKKYNDSFGHAEGDECIKAVASAILSSVRRQTDYAARVGGEEFLVMLTGIEPKQAIQWSLNLKKKIEDLKIPHSKENFLPFVTVSMGLCCCQVTPERDFEKIREEADKSLYDAKYNGRACLSFNKRIFAQITPYQYKRRAHG